MLSKYSVQRCNNGYFIGQESPQERPKGQSKCAEQAMFQA
jgi:hypothetical protein